MKEIKRSFGQIRAAKDDRSVRFTFSTGAKDRHGTRINPSGWRLDNFNKNGIASYQHRAYGDPDPDKIIGPAKAWVEKDKLVGDIEFEPEDVNPLAEKLYRKVRNGTLNAVSVGFMEHEGHFGEKESGEEEDTYYFDDVELLEISLVSIPSNAEALAFRDFEISEGWAEGQMLDSLEEKEPKETISENKVIGMYIDGRKLKSMLETDLTKEVIKSNNMSKEDEKDLAPEENSKVDVNVKIDASELNEALGKFAKKLEDIPGEPPPAMSKQDERDINKYFISE